MTAASIIGGGVAGLATAILLARDGYEVDLFEKNSDLGGRVGLLERDGFRFDTGPSWYLMPEVFDHFFALAGTTTEAELDLRPLDPGYTVFSPPHAQAPTNSGSDPDSRVPAPAARKADPSPRWLTIPRGRDRVRAAFESVEPGSGGVLDRYLDSAKQAKDLALGHFLYNPFTTLGSVLDREVLGHLPRLLTLMTRTLTRHAQGAVLDPVLRQILQYPAIFLGTDPRCAPAIYHLMSTLDLDEGVEYPMGGFRSIVTALTRLAERSGVRLHTGAAVTEIRTEAAPRSQRSRGSAARLLRLPQQPTRRVTGITWTHASHLGGSEDDSTGHRGDDARGNAGTTSVGEEHWQSADVVVSAADLHYTQTRLLAEADQTIPEGRWQKVTSGPGAVLVFLGIRGQLPQLPHHSLFFTEDWGTNFDDIFGPRPCIPSPASIYVCKPSATDPTVAPDGCENLFVLIPVPADAGLGAGGPEGTGDARIELAADRAIDQIVDWADIPDLRERIVLRHTQGPTDFAERYRSWLGGMLGPAHTLDQSAMFRSSNASKKVEGLYFAGATTSPGVGVPMCLISAELVLKHLRGDASPGPLPA